MYTILVLDPDPDICEWLTLALSGDFMCVLSANDLDTALVLCHSVHPNMILFDSRLPSNNEADMIAALRQAAPEAELVLFTTAINPMALAKKLGVSRAIQKPAEPDAVEARVWGVFAQHVCELARTLCAQTTQTSEQLLDNVRRSQVLRKELQDLMNSAPSQSYRDVT